MKILVGFLLFVSVLFGSSYPKDIYENVILYDAKNTVISADELKIAIQNGKDIEKSFEKLAMNWKRVQTLFIASGIDESLIDLPFEIDSYHYGKEDITVALDRIAQGTNDVKTAMFKNSYKSINALEYILFRKKTNPQREYAMASVALESLSQKFKEIQTVYEANKNTITKDESKFNALLLNKLIDSSYEIKEWRLGDTVGLSKKYQDKPDVRRGEFYYSNLSLKSIWTIMDSYAKVIDNPKYTDFGDVSIAYGAKDEVALIRDALNDSLQIEKSMNGDIMNPKSKELYHSLNRLHNGFYVSLISALRMTSKILDADGD